jgi:S-adenosylmethionine:tRNA ribosyltransferase-isomerase
MDIETFNYSLPPELIAQEPASVRGGSRLLVCDRDSNSLSDKQFADIIDLLDDRHFIVVNNTQVVQARMPATKATGGKSELFFLAKIDEHNFTALVKGRMKAGDRLYLADDYVTLLADCGEGQWQIACEKPISELMARHGQLPLPPYIQRQPNSADDSRYQTVYAANDGSVAAPTAGLHFTESIMAALRQKGIEIIELTLHVGIGTFRPIKVDSLDEHIMHAESYTVSESAAERINQLKAAGKKLLAVGTTSVRTLEAATGEDGIIHAGSGSTQLFIRPGYSFKMVDSLLTNFHLPKSSLLVLVSALMGNDGRMQAYQHAVDKQYRFFSYGDAMLIV